MRAFALAVGIVVAVTATCAAKPPQTVAAEPAKPSPTGAAEPAKPLPTVAAERPKLDRFTQEQLATTVVFLFKRTPLVVDGKPAVAMSSGTGTLLASPKGEMVIVTAAHVAKEVGVDGSAVLRGDGDTPIVFSLAVLTNDKGAAWTLHPHADVAVLRLRPEKAFVDRALTKRFLPMSILARDDAAPAHDVPLLAMGFPQNLGVEGRFSPLWLRAMAASGLLTINPDGTGRSNTYFMLDEPAIAGLSGALVFDMGFTTVGANGTGMISAYGPTLARGLVHGTISDPTGGKLAAIVPSSEIVATLRQAGLSVDP